MAKEEKMCTTITRCSRCGQEVNIHEKTCPNCEESLDVCLTTEARICSQCGARLNSKQKKCPLCGIEPEEE